MWSEYEKKLVYVLGIILLIGAAFFGKEFISVNTLIVLGNQLPEYGLIAVALMITLLVGGMNLSIVAMTTLSGVVGGLVMEQWVTEGVLSSCLGVVTMILVGALAGAMNGIIVSYLKVSPILATLGTMLFFRGLALNLTKGGAITSFQSSFTQIGSQSILGIPVAFLIFLITLACLFHIVQISEFGQQMYRIGKDIRSAVYSGINVKKVLLQTYLMAGVIAGIAAIIMTARYNSIRVDYGSGYLMNAMVVVSLGGVDLRGGRGTLKGVILSLLILSVSIRIMNIADLDSNLIDGIMGGMLLIIIVVQHHFGNKRKTERNKDQGNTQKGIL